MGFAIGKFVTKKAHKIKEMLVDKDSLDKYVQNLWSPLNNNKLKHIKEILKIFKKLV